MRRRAAGVLIAFSAATSVIAIDASRAMAECMYLPAWPPITEAIPTAREIVVGEVIDATEADLRLGPDQGPRDHALRITHVLRGGARAGDLLDIQYLLPNWPQTRYLGGDGTTAASCTYLRSEPGEVIALAFDALQPGGPMSDNGVKWMQPPTRYNAVGVLAGHPDEGGIPESVRERVTLPQLLDLAPMPAPLPPAATGPPLQPGAAGANPALLAGLIVLGILLGRQVMVLRGRRVAPDGVRRRER